MGLVVEETEVYVVWALVDLYGDPAGQLCMGIFIGSQENILQHINDTLEWDYELELDDMVFEPRNMYTITEG